MPTCRQCRAESPVSSRWCAMCHANAGDPGVGRLASPGKRLAAHVADLLIPAVTFVMLGGTALMGMATGTSTGAGAGASVAVLLFIAYVVWALKLFANGWTPGKKLLGLRVVREDGQAATFGAMLIREWIGKWISGLFLGLGYFWMLWDRDRQGLHDKVLDTYVVEPIPTAAG